MRLLTLLALAAAACVSADPIPDSYRQNGWFVGSQAYTFKQFSFFEAIAKTKEAGGNIWDQAKNNAEYQMPFNVNLKR